MNIGLDSKTSYIDSRGVAILTECLESTYCIKCHFSENDKTPNTDGFFVLSNTTCPEKEFHVQIKSTENVKNATFTYDTKFINYVNSGVTENPSFIFAVDITERKVYYKYLSDKFLSENNFLDTEQKTITIHFNENEVLTDAKLFTDLLNDIVLSSKIKKFQPKQIDMAEYQTAYDKLNTFFDNDFKKLKDKAFPNVWKFGIVYNRERLPKSVFEEIKSVRDTVGIGTSPYNSTFSVYRVEYGSNQNIFQNLKLSLSDDKIQLPIQNYMSTGVGTDKGMEEDIINWLSHTFKDLINEQVSFIPFIPNDALFEIIFNFIDSEIILRKNKKIKELFDQYYNNGELNSKVALDIINIKYPYNYVNKEIKILKAAINEIIKRDIPKIKRVWEIVEIPTQSIGPRLFNPSIIYKNTYKLFTSLPNYYTELISNLFPSEYLSKYKVNGEYIMYLDIKFLDTGILDKAKFYKMIKNKPFNIEISTNHEDVNKLKKDGYDIWGGGIIHASFNFKENNIINNLLSLLYQKVCSVFSFKKDYLQFKTDF